MQVFISHASTDSELASRVAAVLRKDGFSVWDESQILPGENWGEKLADALRKSDAMVVLLTPNSVRSPNINYEISYALGKEEFKGRLIPVIVSPPGQLSTKDIPWVLNKLSVIRLTDAESNGQAFGKIADALKQAA